MLIGGTVIAVWIEVFIATIMRLNSGYGLNILHRPLLTFLLIKTCCMQSCAFMDYNILHGAFVYVTSQGLFEDLNRTSQLLKGAIDHSGEARPQCYIPGLALVSSDYQIYKIAIEVCEFDSCCEVYWTDLNLILSNTIYLTPGLNSDVLRVAAITLLLFFKSYDKFSEMCVSSQIIVIKTLTLPTHIKTCKSGNVNLGWPNTMPHMNWHPSFKAANSYSESLVLRGRLYQLYHLD